ncbi:hypothetical protein [Streptomyces nanshensis]|uniref:hypothetical protein n=1 Tax=Streptomyces nanshensis TaxID=518642 RepID=UPI00085BE9E2|nr:hypothetical protein [Streptomyces nanshensis]
MRHFIGHHQVVTDDDALELALDLWLGPDEETDEERTARFDAGRDILAEDPELFDLAVRLVVDLARDTRASQNVSPLGAAVSAPGLRSTSVDRETRGERRAA